MLQRRLWIALTICVGIATIGIMGAERSRQATAAGVIDPSCTSSLPCIEYDNNGAGPGTRGVSLAGNGLGGSTKFNSTSAANARAGVFGVDQSLSGIFDSGVSGQSTRGIGVLAQSTFGFGLAAKSAHQTAVFGNSGDHDGVDGVTTNPSNTTGTSQFGVLGGDNSTDGGSANRGVEGISPKGVGVEGFSSAGIGVNAIGGTSATDDLPALSVVGTGDSIAPLIAACATVNPCDHANSAFEVFPSGVVFGNSFVAGFNGGVGVGIASPPAGSVDIVGQYLKGTTCVAGCTVATATSTGRAVTTYAPMVAQPTIEDFGEAQLINGQASVRLDPKFTNVVDQKANYLVFITPEGDASTLYVTQKSTGGFTVRESHGGRSTIAFSYRIVAKPFGSHEARLPMVELPKLHSGLPTQARRFHRHP
jgi:hypothetical protein